MKNNPTPTNLQREKKCPECGGRCWRDEHPDGYMVGPWGCEDCDWSEPKPTIDPPTDTTVDNKYRKKPVVIEAIKWTGSDECFNKVIKLGKGSRKIRLLNNRRLIIETLEGDHEARVGDFIIEGVRGEVYPCKPDIFEETYEKV